MANYVTKENRVKKGDKRTMRDIEKNIERGHEIIKKHERADLSAYELCYFYENFKKIEEEKGTADGLFDLICDVFHMGVAVGARNA